MSAGTPSLIVVTYRDDEAVDAHPLRRLLGELTSVAAVERVTVPPLSLEAVRELASAHAADGDAIYALTRGNSFLVTELLASGAEALPATVRDAVLARIARLSPAARGLLEGVALGPAGAELWLLDAAFPAVADRVDECVQGGVLEAVSGAVGFRHELARLAVESTVAPPRRRDLQAAILAALETAPVDVASSRLAHHAEEAGDTDAVLRHGRAAAERGSRTGAHREAAAQYAARPAPRGRPSGRRAGRPAPRVRARGASERRVRGVDHGTEATPSTCAGRSATGCAPAITWRA